MTLILTWLSQWVVHNKVWKFWQQVIFNWIPFVESCTLLNSQFAKNIKRKGTNQGGLVMCYNTMDFKKNNYHKNGWGKNWQACELEWNWGLCFSTVELHIIKQPTCFDFAFSLISIFDTENSHMKDFLNSVFSTLKFELSLTCINEYSEPFQIAHHQSATGV